MKQTVARDCILSVLPPLDFSRQAPTRADSAAARHWTLNLAALRRTQSSLAERMRIAPVPSGFAWTFGRDAFLTGRCDGRWHQGCSVPLAAGRAMLRTLELTGGVSCYLDIRHAGQVRAVMDSARADQAVICIVTDPSAARVLLGCDDFSTEVSSHRLYLAVGPDWQTDMTELLRDNPGLAVPSQFIRTPLSSDESLQSFKIDAERVFSDTTVSRAVHLQALNASRPEPKRKFCVVAPQRFALWDFAGTILADVLTGDDAEMLDISDPAHAAPLALAIAARDAAAVVAADLVRTDLPGIVHTEAAWISWITRPRVGQWSRNPADAIVLADPAWKSLALASGWPANRIVSGSWPNLRPGAQLSPKRGALSLICDTRPIVAPPRVLEYSSQRLLWEQIEQELLADPMAMGTDPLAYLTQRRESMRIDAAAFDARLFLDRLILPAYQQGLAKLLIAEGIPLALHGAGWNDIESFAGRGHGVVESLDRLRAVAAESCGLVHPFPARHGHPIESLSAPILAPLRRRGEVLSAMASLGCKPMVPRGPVITRATVESLL